MSRWTFSRAVAPARAAAPKTLNSQTHEQDPLDLVRDRLAIGSVRLQESVPGTTPFVDRLLTIDQQLGEGDTQRARADVRMIGTERSDLTSRRHATAGPAEQLVQDPSEELLPGVADAIVQRSKLVDLLGDQARLHRDTFAGAQAH
jgi:hypothetical protein